MFILQIEDEDLERLEKELGRKQVEKVLLIMMVTPKKDWKERGVSDYMMKYEVIEEDEDLLY